MNRAVTSVVLLLTFLAFAMIGGASGIKLSGEQMVHARETAALSNSQQDRCQMAAFCLEQCTQGSVGMRAEIENPTGRTSSKADLDRRPVQLTAAERVFRPPSA